MIKIKNLTKKYELDGKIILDNVNLEVGEGNFVVLIGESGSGKTTLLKMMSGVEKPTEGSVEISEKTSQVFQSGALLPWLSIYENVALPLKLKNMSNAKIKKNTNIALKEVEIENLKTKLPRQVSGGERQRVGIARALSFNAPIILMDEPFSALDIKTTEDLHKIILDLWVKRNLTIVMISHSLEEAAHLGQKIVLLKNAKIHKVFENKQAYPRDETSLEFLELIHRMKRELR